MDIYELYDTEAETVICFDCMTALEAERSNASMRNQGDPCRWVRQYASDPEGALP